MVRSKEAEIGKGTCIINTWEKFLKEFKKSFFPNNVMYEVKRSSGNSSKQEAFGRM